MVPLASLAVGECARIASVAGNATIGQRLLEMGILEGETIELTRVAPLGDPIEIRIRDYRLSLRRSEAALIVVEKLSRER